MALYDTFFQKRPPSIYDVLKSSTIFPTFPTVFRTIDYWISHYPSRCFKRQSLMLGHYGCVNAVAVAPYDNGELIASGGDDERVLLWNAFAPKRHIYSKSKFVANSQTSFCELNSLPLCEFVGHEANIFSIAFSPDRSKVISCGLDSKICVYDIASPRFSSPSSISTTRGIYNIARAGEPVHALKGHRGSVQQVAFLTNSSDVFLSVCQNGDVFLWDLRTFVVRQSCLLEIRPGLNTVACCPTNDYQIVSGGQSAILHDLRAGRRSSFQRASDLLSENSDSPTQPLSFRPPCPSLTSSSESSRPRGRPEISSCEFSSNGSLIIATLTEGLPTLIDVKSFQPVACLTDPLYRNECTRKQCAFVGENQTLVAGGSNDWKVYLWDLSSLDTVSLSCPSIANSNEDRDPNDISHIPHIPSLASISGCRSIPNGVVYHPSGRLLVHGVEKVIRSWDLNEQYEHLETDLNDVVDDDNSLSVTELLDSGFSHPTVPSPKLQIADWEVQEAVKLLTRRVFPSPESLLRTPPDNSNLYNSLTENENACEDLLVLGQFDFIDAFGEGSEIEDDDDDDEDALNEDDDCLDEVDYELMELDENEMDDDNPAE